MILGQFVLEANEANAFIIGCRETREAVLVDAGTADPRFEPYLEMHELRLVKIFITHHHWDHTDGLAELMRKHAVPAYSFGDSVANCPTTRLRHGDTFTFGRFEGRVVHTPGHTPDGISLIFPGLAFTGDALFAGSVGGTASAEDAERQLKAIRQHLFTLPDDTELHVGHGPSSTVRVEREFNPFFQ